MTRTDLCAIELYGNNAIKRQNCLLNIKQDASLQTISLKYEFHKVTRLIKLPDYNEIRQLQDVCIF